MVMPFTSVPAGHVDACPIERPPALLTSATEVLSEELRREAWFPARMRVAAGRTRATGKQR
jgi:hypothetical protein